MIFRTIFLQNCEKRNPVAGKLLLAAILLAGLFLLMPARQVHAYGEFCHGSELSRGLRPFLQGRSFGRKTSQGMCIADDCIIYTRFDNDWSETTYVVVDIKTRKEIGRYNFHTRHSNSLAYNPNTRQLVAVSQRHAYIFHFENHVLSLVSDVTMTRNCPKITYVSSMGAFYVATDTTVYMTTDFINLHKVFNVDKLAVDQGMGFDGAYLYIVWYRVGYNILAMYTPDGKFSGIYTVVSSAYREVEDLDFYNGKMVLNIANSGDKDGIYYVNPEHFFGSWTITKEPTCSEEGMQSRRCQKCGVEDYTTVPATGQHIEGEWQITAHPTCLKEGYAVKQCTQCGQTLKSDHVPATGHAFGDWIVKKNPTVFETGIQRRTCTQCDVVESKEIAKLKAVATLNKKEVELGFNEAFEDLKVDLSKGDYITEWLTGNPAVAAVDETGTIKGRLPGKTTITVKTKAGATASCRVRVRLFEK